MGKSIDVNERARWYRMITKKLFSIFFLLLFAKLLINQIKNDNYTNVFQFSFIVGIAYRMFKIILMTIFLCKFYTGNTTIYKRNNNIVQLMCVGGFLFFFYLENGISCSIAILCVFVILSK